MKKIIKEPNLDWKEDMEKIITGILLSIVIIAVTYKYLLSGTVDQGMVYLAGLMSSAFILRKGLSYWKPDQYYKNSPNYPEKTTTAVIPFSQVQPVNTIEWTETATYTKEEETQSNGSI